MADKNSFGSILRRLREEKQKKWIERKQWSQTAVARRIGVTRQAYIAWENDDSLPDTDNLKHIIEVFRPNENDALALYRAVERLPPEKQKLPPCNTLFTGRNDYLDELHRKLQEGGSVAITQAVGISGLGGIGKTQIALEYAHQHHPDVYRTVLWVNATDRVTLQADYDELARLLELPEWYEQDADQRVEAVKRWLDEHTRWLLIMDNADDLQLARSFMPGRILGNIILTTRAQAIRESNIAVQLVVEGMKPQEAVIFLLRRAGLWDEESKLDDDAKLNTVVADIREAATELVTLLGGHPLAINQAGAYIEATGILLPDYLQLYKEKRQQLLDDTHGLSRDSPADHPESVTTTLQLCVNKACELDALAGDVLAFCSFLQPDAMPEEVFYKDSTMQLTLQTFNDAMVALRRYSLVERNAQEKLLATHRLVQAILIEDMPSELQKQWRERVTQALNAAFPEAEFKEWITCGRLLPHVLACAAWAADELTPTVGVARLFHEAGIYLRERGQYAEAEPLLARAISVWETNLGDRSVEAARSMHHLAILYRRQGKQERVEPLYKQVLSIYELNLGPEHPDTASIVNDQAVLYDDRGEYEKAELLFQHALSIRKKCLGDKHPHTAISLYNLAGVYYIQDKYEQAEHFYQQTLTIWKEQLEPEHPYIAMCLNSLALLYWRQNKYELAEPLYRQSLAIREKRLGADHHDTAWSLYRLAQLLRDQGEYKQAEPMYQRALDIQERRLGMKHLYTQETRRDYAAFLRSLRRDDEAAALEAHDEPSV